MDSDAIEKLKELYYSTSSPAGLRSRKKLSEAAKKEGISQRDVDAFLLKQATYTSFKPARTRFRSGFYNLFGSYKLAEVDLMDVTQFSRFNNNIKYLFVLIDVFSKRLFVKPLKSKTSAETARALRAILSENKITFETIQADMGSEWKKDFASLLKELNIRFRWAVTSLHKASVVERVQRTLRSLLNKYMYSRQTKVYYDELDNIVQSYNTTVHSSTKFAPNDVKPANYYEIWSRKYLRNARPIKPPKYRPGQTVRISKIRHTLDKRTKQSFTEEIFTIYSVVRRNSIYMYELKDSGGEHLQGLFYEQELSPVTVDDTTLYKIDRIIKYKGRDKKRQALVSWSGFPLSAASWIPVADIQGYSV